MFYDEEYNYDMYPGYNMEYGYGHNYDQEEEKKITREELLELLETIDTNEDAYQTIIRFYNQQKTPTAKISDLVTAVVDIFADEIWQMYKELGTIRAEHINKWVSKHENKKNLIKVVCVILLQYNNIQTLNVQQKMFVTPIVIMKNVFDDNIGKSLLRIK